MLRSMTGFSRAEKSRGAIDVLVELKTVNAKYLYVDVSISDTFSELELDVSRYLKERLKRGTVKARMEVFLTDNGELLKPDFSTATSIYTSLKAISEKFGLDGELSLDTMARFKEIFKLKPSHELVQMVWETLEKTLEEATTTLNTDREREGLNLAAAMEGYLDRLHFIAQDLNNRTEDMINYYREYLRKRLDRLLESRLDENRLEQEVVLLAEKADISEEVVRLNSHIDSFREIIDSSVGESGVQLDFICQEMNRELSTVAAKSKQLEVSALTVEGRTLVNKLREQVQNVE